jgi:superfamily I DNA/RNA helicase
MKDYHGKVLFSSFHSSKGLERKVVVIFNFDDSYFKYYAKEKPVNICPNLLTGKNNKLKYFLVY